MEKWIFDRLDVPGEVVRKYIKDCYQQNLLIQSKLEVGDKRVDLKKLTMPLLNMYGKFDQIVLMHALKGEIQVISDVATDKHVQYKKETLKEGIAAMVCAPIKFKESVIGVLRLYSAVKREFSEDTLMLVNAIAHQGGLAIQKASMYLSLENDKKNLEQEIWSHRQWL